jgi:hypothetical protein
VGSWLIVEDSTSGIKGIYMDEIYRIPSSKPKETMMEFLAGK